jgi:hypothetical protein
MLEVVRRRPDLRQLLQLMYVKTGNSSTHDRGGSGSGGKGSAGNSGNTSSEAGSSGGDSSSRSSRRSGSSGDSVDSSAAAAWHAAASQTSPEQGQMRAAITAAAASPAQVTTSDYWQLCRCNSVACT